MTTQSTIALTGRGIYIRPDGRVVLPGLRLTVSAIRALEGLHGAKHDGKTNEWVVDTRRSIFSLPILGNIVHSQPDLCDELDQGTVDRLLLARQRYVDNVDASDNLEPPAEVMETLKALLPDTMTTKMRPYQYAAVDYALRRARKRAFLGDDPGAGKTMCSLAATWAANAARPALIVCKSTLKGNWRNEILNWLPDGQTIHILDGTTNVGIPDNVDWIICNYDILFQRLPDLVDAKPTALILDESQKVKSHADFDPQQKGKYLRANPDDVLEWVAMTPAEQRENKDRKSDLIGNVGNQASWASRHLSLMDQTELVLLLSATPAPNGKHYEWWPQIEVLGRGKDFGGREAFVERYCRWCKECVNSRFRVCTHRTWATSKFGRREVENRDGAINADELSRRLRAAMMVRRSQRQMYPHLPPIQPVEVFLPLTDARRTHPITGDKVNWRAEYVKAEEEFVEWLKDHAAATARSSGESPGKAVARAIASTNGDNAQFVQLAKLREIAAYAKMDAVIDWMIDLTGETEEDGSPRKAVIFAWNRAVQQYLIQRLEEWVRPPNKNAKSGYGSTHMLEELERHYGKGNWPGVPRILAATDMTSDEIEDSKQRFQEVPAEPFLVASIAAAAEGHTLDSGWWVVQTQPGTAGPGVTRQMVGRCYGRASNPHGAFYASLIATDPRGSFQTIEERLHEKLKINQVLMANTLDEGRTLEWGDLDETDSEAMSGAMGSVFDDMLKGR